MEYNKAVADFASGDEIEGFYLLNNASVRRTAAGKAYLSAALTDCTGSMDAKLWDYSGTLPEEGSGSVVKVRGQVSEYKGAMQFTIQRIRFAGENDDYDLSALVPTAPIDRDQVWEDIQYTVSTFTDTDYRRICETMLERHKDAFRSIPAAKSVHHSFVSGLLMHTGNMLRTADFLADVYSEVIDRSLLLAGTLLHDIAKEYEFTFSRLGLVTDYSVKGDLLGHLVMGAQEVAEVAKELGVSEEKSILLQHMLLSHHGDPETGAAVIPQTAEAELLSFIDRIDSRMEIYAETFSSLPVGQFSPRIFALEKKIYHHA